MKDNLKGETVTNRIKIREEEDPGRKHDFFSIYQKKITQKLKEEATIIVIESLFTQILKYIHWRTMN